MKIVLSFVWWALLSPNVSGYLIVQDDDSSSEGEHELGLKQRVKNLEENLSKLQETMEHRNNCSDTSAPVKACSDGWLPNNGSCYYFGRENINFETAKTFCASHNASLVHIETATEDEFLKSLFTAILVQQVSFWIGLSDAEIEGVWRWYDNGLKATYLGWIGEEPNNVGNEDCAVIHMHGIYGWVDYPCGNKYRALCEQTYKPK